MKRLLSTLAFVLCAYVSTPFGCNAQGGGCTTHQECGTGGYCIFSTGSCGVKCDPTDAAACAAPATCVECATSTCPTCKGCISVCVTPVAQGGPAGPAGGW